MELFNLNTLKEVLNPTKFIDQAEKNTQALFAYVQPAELSKTLVAYTSDTTDFIRAQVSAFDSIVAIAKKQTEDFTNSLLKASK